MFASDHRSPRGSDMSVVGVYDLNLGELEAHDESSSFLGFPIGLFATCFCFFASRSSNFGAPAVTSFNGYAI